jgi:hypothetical protein
LKVHLGIVKKADQKIQAQRRYYRKQNQLLQAQDLQELHKARSSMPGVH